MTLGLVARQQLYKALWLQQELNYVRKGGQLTGAGFYDEDPIVINYVQVPVLLHVQLPIAGALAVYAQGGGVLNLGLNSRRINPQYYAGGNKYGTNPLILAPAVGAGLAWQQPQRSYYLNFRYSADSRDFFERSYGGKDYTLRNKGITLTAGVLFGLSAQPPAPPAE
ncbi:PorT family protein [Hymenobacter actinosclerus]|uniref:PorT family protein n=1 Tax=Hymenobacter actinosclerus TaxID=82805 RepID=UPI001FE15668|nr:PorT family protein [Hymenobacter actinosclerus]